MSCNIPGAIEVTTGAWVYRLGRRRAADFIALLQMIAEAFPLAPAIVVICDNDSIHHARKVTAYLGEPCPLTRPDAGHRGALDQPMAIADLRAELLEWRFSRFSDRAETECMNSIRCE